MFNSFALMFSKSSAAELSYGGKFQHSYLFLYPPAVFDSSPCWGTSYALCTKQQIVDLAAKGIDAVLIDKKRPKIIVRDW